MRTVLALGASLVIFGASVALAGQGQPDAGAVPPPGVAAPATAPSGPDTAAQDTQAQAILATTCTGCHDLSMIDSRPHTRAEWPGILNTMVGNGANLSDGDYKLLLGYLQRKHSAAG